MEEMLKQLFGEAVTDEAVKTFNSELGKKFVAKTDFNAKIEEIKSLKSEKTELETEINKLNDTAKNGENVKAELEALKAQIDNEKKQAEAERIMREKNESIEKRFNAVVGDKQFNHAAIRADYLRKFGEALENKDFEGKGDNDIFHALTKDDGGAFKGVTVVKLAGGMPRSTGKSYNNKEEIMSIKDRAERRQAIAENPSLFGITNKGE